MLWRSPDMPGSPGGGEPVSGFEKSRVENGRMGHPRTATRWRRKPAARGRLAPGRNPMPEDKISKSTNLCLQARFKIVPVGKRYNKRPGLASEKVGDQFTGLGDPREKQNTRTGIHDGKYQLAGI